MPLGDGILNCPGGTLARTLTNKPCKLTSYFSQASKNPGGGGTPLQGLNGDVRPARVCFSGFLYQKSEFCLKQGRKISDI